MKKIFISLFCSLIVLGGMFSVASALTAPADDTVGTDYTTLQQQLDALLKQVYELQWRLGLSGRSSVTPGNTTSPAPTTGSPAYWVPSVIEDSPDQIIPNAPIGNAPPSDNGLLRVIYPNGGEKWDIHTGLYIKWFKMSGLSDESLSSSARQTISIVKNNTIVCKIADISGRGTLYSFPNLKSVCPALPSGDDYKIRVQFSGDGMNVSDESDSIFSISTNIIPPTTPNSPPTPTPTPTPPTAKSITLISPDSNVYTSGSNATVYIRWSSSGISGNGTLLLLKNNASSKTIGTVSMSAKSFNWKLPGDIVTGNYRILLKDDSGTITSGIDEGIFSVVSPSQNPPTSSGVKITYPNGRVSLKIGETYAVRWQALAFKSTADVSITLINQDTSEEVLIANTKNSGSYKWKIPETLGGMNLSEGLDTLYRIKVRVGSDVQNDFDLSDNAFSIIDSRASNVKVTRATNTPKSRDVRTGEKNVEFLRFRITNSGKETVNIVGVKGGIFTSPNADMVGLDKFKLYEFGDISNSIGESEYIGSVSGHYFEMIQISPTTSIIPGEMKEFTVKADVTDHSFIEGSKIYINIQKISFSIGSRSFEANVTGVNGNAMKVVSISPTTNKPIIKISAPNGGETFKTSPESDMGTQIRWTSTNMGSLKVRIDLIGEDGLVRNIASGASNTGYRFWHVSMDIPTGKYKIKIASEDQGASAVDMSDGYFNVVNTNIIAEVPSLPAPTGVNATASRENTSVSWNSVSGATAYWIYRASGSTITERSKEKAVLIGSAGGVGATEKVSYIDEKPKCGVTHAYYVKTHNATTGKTSDMSASAETLIPCPIVPGNTSPKITLTNPNGGSFRMKDILKIRWDAENLGAVSNQKIELMVGEAPVCTLATPAITNGENVYEWEISSSQCSYVGPGPGYKIRISLASGSTVVSDTSDSAFTILSSVDAPTLTITSPNGGEMFEREKTMEIKWSSTNYTGNVVLTLVDRNRYPVMQIKSGIPASTGSFVWTIPKANIYEANYKILIQGDLVAGYQAPLDYSDNTFYISVPTTTSGALGKPTNFAFLGYEMSGNTAISKFEYMDNAVGESGYYIYWDDGMKGYVSPTTVTSDTGKRTSYIGRIFDCTKIPKTVYIRAFKDLDLSEPSNVVSTPTPPVCEAPVTKVLSPNGGELYKQGDSVSIKWTATNLGSSNSVAISVYKARSDNNYYGIAPDFGLTFYNNVSGGVVQDEGSYTWTIPQNFTTGQYVVFVAGAKGTYDTSDAPFTITTASGGVSANILDSVKIQLDGLKELLMKLR